MAGPDGNVENIDAIAVAVAVFVGLQIDEAHFRIVVWSTTDVRESLDPIFFPWPTAPEIEIVRSRQGGGDPACHGHFLDRDPAEMVDQRWT